MDRHSQVYELSKRYGPPQINLRESELIESFGSETYAAHPIDHQVPEDVSRDDLDYYRQSVYCFMKFRDLLFYLYPVASEYEKDNDIECIDSYLYQLDRNFAEEFPRLPEEDREALIAGLKWMWAAGAPDSADWEGCPSLQKAIGVSLDENP